MIKNDRQYRLTRAQLQRFEALLEDLRHRPNGTDDELHDLEVATVEGQVEELTAQLEEYDALRTGRTPVGRLESLDQLPTILLRARIAAGLSQRELAERLGMREQQIQRYEAEEWATANLSRLIEVAHALSVHLDASIVLAAHDLSLPRLTRELRRAGLDADFVQRRLAPPSVDVKATADNGQGAPVLDLAARIGRVYGWAPSAVLRGEVPAEDLPLPTAAGFKLPKRLNQPRVKAYTVYAHYLALLVLQATADRLVRPIPQPAAAFRAAVLERFGTIDFSTVLAFVWDLGIPVLPLADPGAFHAAVWRTGGRNVIVLKQQDRKPSRWLFDLLHEVDHATDAPDKPELVVVDDDDTDVAGRESDANMFAGDVVLAGRSIELALACTDAAHGAVHNLKRVVPRVADDAGVDVGVLANYLAYRLSFTPTGRRPNEMINWWPTAANLQPSGPDPWEIARDRLLAAADLGRLSPVDRSLLSQALTD